MSLLKSAGWLLNEFLLQLVECLPIYSLYGVDVCPVTKEQIYSMYFTITRFMMKLLKNNNIDIIRDSILYLNFQLPRKLILKRND